jgi:hypothetical protein
VADLDRRRHVVDVASRPNGVPLPEAPGLPTGGT